MRHTPRHPFSTAAIAFGLCVATPDLTAQQALSTTSGGYVTVPHAAALVPPRITVEACVIIDPANPVDGTIVRKDPTPNVSAYLLRLQAGRPQWRIEAAGGSTTVLGPAPLPLNTPIHLAGTYDNSTARLYVNGVQVASAPAPWGNLADTGGPLHIGRGEVGRSAEQFAGRIDAVRIWNRPRLASELVEWRNRQFVSGTGLIAAWNFNGNLDDSVAGRNGAAVGSISYTPEFCAYGTALDLSSDNNYVTVANAPELMPSHITVEVWCRPSANNYNFGTLVRKDPTAFRESYLLRLEVGRPAFYIRTTSGPVSITATTPIPTDAVTHISASYDGQFVRLFVNGVEVGTGTPATGPIQASSGPLILGHGDTGVFNEEFNGWLDEVRIYSHARAPASHAHYANTEFNLFPGLVAAFSFNGNTDSSGGRVGTLVGTAPFGPELAPMRTTTASAAALGSGSGGCGFTPLAGLDNPPIAGGPSFSFRSENGPPNVPGIIAFGAPVAPFSVLGATFHVLEIANLPVTSNSLGTSGSSLTLPFNLRGAIGVQYAWLCPGFTFLSATNGITLNFGL